QKKRKKKRTTNNKDFRLFFVQNNKYLDDDLVVTQILTRLPAKSLMRFKFVCKSWKSIIEQDSHFINLHYTHSQARPPTDLDCDGGDGDVRKATIRSSAITLRSPSPNVKVVGPVRGLLCFADLANFDVMIYNVSTRNLDPDTGDHKVICVWHHPPGSSACCEVLTVGVDASWRIIDALPKCQFDDRDCTYANGSVYWRTSPYGSLLEFDMGSEKFRTIRIPEFIDRGKLIELDGCLTMVPYHRLGRRIVTLWTFHDRNKKCSNGTTSNTSEGEE
ncbi:Putative F-box protein At1g32420, partial [Linum grandiflorum]